MGWCYIWYIVEISDGQKLTEQLLTNSLTSYFFDK